MEMDKYALAGVAPAVFTVAAEEAADFAGNPCDEAADAVRGGGADQAAFLRIAPSALRHSAFRIFSGSFKVLIGYVQSLLNCINSTKLIISIQDCSKLEIIRAQTIVLLPQSSFL